MQALPSLQEQAEEPRLQCPQRPPRRRRRHRPHRFRHYRARRRVRAVDRVVRRRRHQERINFGLRLLSVPVLAVTPASLVLIDAPINYAIAMPLAVMGLVLMFGPRA